MAGNAIAALTPLLLAGAEAGVVHRQPNQVSLVMVQLGGELISQLGDFRLVLLADVDAPGRGREEKHRGRKSVGDERQSREAAEYNPWYHCAQKSALSNAYIGKR